ncbi:MAG: YicC/YloC family endoribonuclease [Paracoccaceae bacterium]
MTKSMTGFAADKGQVLGWSWAWDIRSVNARGLDVRMRLPDWIEGLEPALRPVIQKALARGNVSLSLKVQRDDTLGALTIENEVLDHVLATIKRIEVEASGNHNLHLAPTSAAEIMAMRGIGNASSSAEDTAPLLAALRNQLPKLLSAFNAMRAAEGAALEAILRDQIDQIEKLTAAATREAEARRAQMATSLRENLARVLGNAEGADPDRVAQELALIAVKTDVAEELDRLRAHVAAARDLLTAKGPVGRKLDFLTQEFNREANTLCSKSQSAELTRIGLDLKHVIDQMREQVQNVE